MSFSLWKACLGGNNVIPIRDENPAGSPPHVTRLIIVVNVIVFFVVWLSDYVALLSGFKPPSLEVAVQKYGMIPINIMNGKQLYTVFTSMFMHGGIIHLGGNMLYLYIFGDNVEYAFGHGKYVFFYFLCGIVASITHIFSITTTADLLIPTVGASGAISGVLGAYILLYPRARVLTLVLFRFLYFTRIPAVFFLGFWFIFQLLEGVLTLGLGVPSGVAYWAHIGGFIAGMVLGLTVRGRRKPRI